MVIGLTAVMAFATLENLEYMTAMFINPHFLSSGLVLRHHRLRFLMGDVAQVELSDHTSSLIQTVSIDWRGLVILIEEAWVS